MFTRCPTCQTLFRVRPETLRIAHGQVRCGRCDTQFNALDTLAEDPEILAGIPAPEAVQPPADSDFIYVRPDTSEPETEAVEEPATLRDTVVSEPESVASTAETEVPLAAAPSVETPPEATAVAVVSDAGTGALAQGPAPVPGLTPAVIQELLLHEEHAASGRGRRWAWGIAAGVGLLMLGGQWVYLQRAHLYDYPALRPALQRLCDGLGCALPLPRAPERIEVIERSVRAHPRVADALLVEVTFVSRADVPIAYPILELQLADVSGNRVAARRFAPAEYLPPGVDAERGLAAGRPLQVTLELVAPRTEVVSFQFEFF